MASSKNLKEIFRQMQFAIKACERWAREMELEFSPSKTFGLLFTRKHNYEEATTKHKITIYGSEIRMVTQMKHLGLTFDKLLNFTEHFRIKTNKMKSDIARAANMMSTKAGCKPKAMLLFYKSIIRPTLTYGAICFAKRLQYKNNIKKCTQIQSFAYSTMGLIRKNTPCAAIDVILNNMPLDLYMHGHATMSHFRLKGHELVDPNLLETCHPQLEGRAVTVAWA